MQRVIARPPFQLEETNGPEEKLAELHGRPSATENHGKAGNTSQVARISYSPTKWVDLPG
jgi:hypothetical protein